MSKIELIMKHISELGRHNIDFELFKFLKTIICGINVGVFIIK